MIKIRDGRIVSVTPNGIIPDGAETTDLGDATLLPGLADLHTHRTYSPTDFGYNARG